MVKGCVVLIIGLPASGKTIFATKLVDHMRIKAIDIDPLYISFDKVIPIETQKILVHRQDSSWRECRKEFVKSCYDFLELFLGSSSTSDAASSTGKYLDAIVHQFGACNIKNFHKRTSDFCFIVEDNFYYKSMREEFFRLSKHFQLGIALISFNVPINVCLKQNETRMNPVDNLVIQKMAEIYEKPKADDFGTSYKNKVQLMEINFDDSNVNNYDLLCTQAVTLIRKTLKNPIESNLDDIEEFRMNSRKITESNLIHKFDKLLRQCVGEILKERPNEYDGKQISIVRKELLKKFVDNQIDYSFIANFTTETSEQILIRSCKDLIKKELIKKT